MTGDDRRHQQGAFAKFLTRHMTEWCEVTGKHPVAWAKWTYGIHADYRKLAETTVLVDSVRLHEHAAHMLSSQVFAFNLFLPFRDGGKDRLSQHLSEVVGAHLIIDKVRLEWVPPGELLGELNGEWPVGDEPATGVDVALWGWLENRRRAVILLEIKLSEGEFSHCGGRISTWNRRQDICDSAKGFLAEPHSCYLTRPRGKRRDRRYWEIFTMAHGSVREAFPYVDLEGKCPFAFDMQQPMRNLAIARALEQEDIVEKAWFALCAHDSNAGIAGLWENWKRLLPDPSMAPTIAASEVIAIGEAEGLMDWASYMRRRYCL